MTLIADMWSCGEAEEELFAVQEIKQRLFPKDGSTKLNGRQVSTESVSQSQTVCLPRLMEAVCKHKVAVHSMDTVWECPASVRSRGADVFGAWRRFGSSATQV